MKTQIMSLILISGSLALATSSACLTTYKSEAKSFKIDIVRLPVEKWPEAAQKEIQDSGPIVGIPNGVIHSVVRNQECGEICWSYTLNERIEAFLKSKNVNAKLSPEYVQFWHVYQQFYWHLSDFMKVSQKLNHIPKTHPDYQRIKDTLERLVNNGGNRQAAFTDLPAEYFHIEIGNNEPFAVQEALSYGIVPFQIYKTKVKTVDQEQNLEKTVESASKDLLMSFMNHTQKIQTFFNADQSLNLSLFNYIKEKMDPIMGVPMLKPTDTWDYEGKTYSALSYLENINSNLGLKLGESLKPFVATRATHDQAVKAIAVALLKSNLPVPLGTMLFGDKLGQVNIGGKLKDIDAMSYAEKTGLFTNSVCKGGQCQEFIGGHEIEVVNFRAQAVAGFSLPEAPTKEQMISYLLDGKVKVSSLIIQNSWGPNVGLDPNGNLAKSVHSGGYFVFTTDYLLNTGFKSDTDMYDFMIPTEVAKMFPELKSEQ